VPAPRKRPSAAGFLVHEIEFDVEPSVNRRERVLQGILKLEGVGGAVQLEVVGIDVSVFVLPDDPLQASLLWRSHTHSVSSRSDGTDGHRTGVN